MAYNYDSTQKYCGLFSVGNKLTNNCTSMYADVNITINTSVTNPKVELSYTADYANSVKINMTKVTSTSYTAKLPLNGRGYTQTSNIAEAKIVVYGSIDAVTHFSRRQADGTYKAKIGFAELLKHQSYSPYNRTKSNDITYYGPAIAYFK